MLPTSALHFELPPSLVATRPAEPRDAARLLVVSRTDPSLVEHHRFADLPGYLRSGDLMLVNRTSVLPARFRGRRIDTGAKLEGLFLAEPSPGRWGAMIKSNTRLRAGHILALANAAGADSPFGLRVLERDDDVWNLQLIDAASEEERATPAREVLEGVGATPLPPYIRAARRDAHAPLDLPEDRCWYQTVYADPARAASVAAPTAGLHFTPELLASLERLGVARAPVVLDVGHGTFKPIETDTADEHPIHAEHVHIPAETIRAIEDTRSPARRRICVGTTTVRAVESLPHPITPDVRARGLTTDTSLYILPGFTFRHTDAMITNFHLPGSTLLALVGAFLPGGVDRLIDLYRQAIAREYRFYSYGDAMLILP